MLKNITDWRNNLSNNSLIPRLPRLAEPEKISEGFINNIHEGIKDWRESDNKASNIYKDIIDWRERLIADNKAFRDRGYMTQAQYDKYEAPRLARTDIKTGDEIMNDIYKGIIDWRDKLLADSKALRDRGYMTQAQYDSRLAEIDAKTSGAVVSDKSFTDLYKTMLPTTAFPTNASEKTTPSAINYTVVSGDTLSAIAKKYATTVDDLMKSNSSITDPGKIYIGQKITIPGIANTSSPDTVKEITPSVVEDKTSTDYYATPVSNTDTAKRIINKSIPYVYNERMKLTPAQEIAFQSWWKPTASANALNIDADSKDQDYDYRKLWAIEKAKDPEIDPITKISSDYAARQIDTEKLKEDIANDNTSLYNYSDDSLRKIAKSLYNTQQEQVAIQAENNRQAIQDVANALIRKGIYPKTFTAETVEVYETIKNTQDVSGLKNTYNNLLQKEQRGEILTGTEKSIYDAIKYKLNL